MIWAPLLLADPSPCLRLLVLQELLGQTKEDREVGELTVLRDRDPLITELESTQGEDGSWSGGVVPSFARASRLRSTSLALLRLGYLGLVPGNPMVQRGAEFLFARQLPDGSWPLPSAREAGEEREGYSMVPLQTAIPLRALACCGYATDPRAERAYEWLIAQRLADGAWPTGIASGNYGYVAGYRRLAHSRWGCRSNTTEALNCLALHPELRTGGEARRALDLLLGRETHERHALGYEVVRLVGAEQARGFLTRHARFDVALVLDLCWRIGASLDDERVAGLVEFVREAQGTLGLWDYAAKPQATRWVTFDLLRSLTRLSQGGSAESEWLSLEPRTLFQAYSRKPRRY